MSEVLTQQDKTFIKEVVKTGNGTKAAKKAYGIDNPNYAGVKAHELLRKPKIQKAVMTLAERLPDSLILKKHKKLLEQKKVEYFWFPKYMEDEEIIAQVKAAGFDVITVEKTEKGKHAFYSIDDTAAISKGLEMAYRLKNLYQQKDPASTGNTFNTVIINYGDKPNDPTQIHAETLPITDIESN